MKDKIEEAAKQILHENAGGIEFYGMNYYNEADVLKAIEAALSQQEPVKGVEELKTEWDRRTKQITMQGDWNMEALWNVILPHITPNNQQREAVDPTEFLNWKERSGYVFVESKRSEAFVNKKHGILVNGSDYHYQKLIDEYGKTLKDLLKEYKEYKA